MNDFGIIFLSILFEALPFVLIGTIASAMIELFVSEQWVRNHLPKKEKNGLLILSPGEWGYSFRFVSVRSFLLCVDWLKKGFRLE